jgi:hypothetical protein
MHSLVSSFSHQDKYATAFNIPHINLIDYTTAYYDIHS